ncbi:dephospho-CoA kinase [Fenollaria massiliensis]|uniref:Dephospho-CoA kinase n=1 Tax=Fenollaria massiliensis TaxID=938288 RepID=A0A9E7DIN3_9FIRM|nr:dephospho-CoA kinase [Fenollaria massiliensis]UQK58564.1 dephospho-CoA kinase [Fenollaria massiliensis]
MQNNYILTGSIASGKSSVLKIIAEEGYNTISADDVVKELYEDEEFLKSFKIEIGEKFFTIDKKLDKDKLRETIFKDISLKNRVEAFVHPLVYKKIKEMLLDGFNFIEVPMFFEAREYFLDSKIEIKGIIFVNIDKKIQVSRLMHRNKISEKEAIAMIDTRVTSEEKIKASNYIINNNASEDDLKREVLKTLERINEKAN